MVWSIKDGYPYIDSVSETINVFTEEYPSGIWKSSGNYPYYDAVDTVVDVLVEPYPVGLFIQDRENYPRYNNLDMVRVGAFAYASNLKYVKIPKSVKYIGEWAFTGTALTEVTISKDCTYYPTSFPDGCAIKYYE